MQSEPSIPMTIFGGPDTEPIRRVSTERVMTRWASVSPVCQITLAKRAKSWIQSRSGWGPTGTQGACRSASGVPPSGDWVPIVCARSRRLDPGGFYQSPDRPVLHDVNFTPPNSRFSVPAPPRRLWRYSQLGCLEALLSGEQHPGATSGAGGAGIQSPIPRFSITSASTSAVTSFLAASSSAASASASAWSAASWAAAASASAWLAASWAA